MEEPDQAENPKCLELSKLRVHETVAWTLMNSGATPSVISRDYCEILNLHTESVGRQIKTATGDKSHLLDVLKKLLVEFGRATVGHDFLVVERCPYDTLISRATMRRMGGNRDMTIQTYSFDDRKNSGERISVQLVETLNSVDRETGPTLDSVDFTLESDEYDDEEVGKEAAEESDEEVEADENEGIEISHFK